MSDQFDPQALAAAIAQIKASLPGTPRTHAAGSAAGATVHTVDEALRLVEMFASRIDASDMWPVTTETTREPDGTLLLRVSPNN